MKRRAGSAMETHGRIVRATAELHREKGVAATTFRDIATRADVGIGTVYHHFPTYDDVITACGHHTMASAQPPHPKIFETIRAVDERIRLLVRELFDFYRRLPQFGRIRSERHQFPPLDAGFLQEEEARRALVDEALRGTRAGTRLRALVFALVDFAVYDGLSTAGLDHDAAVHEVTNIVLTRLRARRSKS